MLKAYTPVSLEQSQAPSEFRKSDHILPSKIKTEK